LPESETNFYFTEMPALKLTFRKDATGKVSRLATHLKGTDHEEKRLGGDP